MNSGPQTHQGKGFTAESSLRLTSYRFFFFFFLLLLVDLTWIVVSIAKMPFSVPRGTANAPPPFPTPLLPRDSSPPVHPHPFSHLLHCPYIVVLDPGSSVYKAMAQQGNNMGTNIWHPCTLVQTACPLEPWNWVEEWPGPPTSASAHALFRSRVFFVDGD